MAERLGEQAGGRVKRDGAALPSVPSTTIDGFMGAGFASDLLAFAQAGEAHFARSQVTSPDEKRSLDEGARRSWTFEGDLGPLRLAFEKRVRMDGGKLFARLGMTAPVDLVLDTGLAAHRNGDYFRSHVDVFAEEKRQFATYDRLVSVVYYVRAEPPAFGGGELALHTLFGGGDPRPIEPRHDRLVIFPSYAPHEVLPVVLPGDSFAGARFSLNCWIGRLRG